MEMDMDKSSTEPFIFDFPPHAPPSGKTAVKASWIYLRENAFVI